MKKSDIFKFEFDDPDKNILKDPEVTLVHNFNNNSEWKYWYENGKCPEPPSWDMIDDAQNLYLEASQQCPVLIKFFSFRDSVVSSRSTYNNDPMSLTPRKIKVKVNEKVLAIINVIPQPNPIDHIFRFYEAENTYTTIILPSFTSIPLSTYPDLFIE